VKGRTNFSILIQTSQQKPGERSTKIIVSEKSDFTDKSDENIGSPETGISKTK